MIVIVRPARPRFPDPCGLSRRRGRGRDWSAGPGPSAPAVVEYAPRRPGTNAWALLGGRRTNRRGRAAVRWSTRRPTPTSRHGPDGCPRARSTPETDGPSAASWIGRPPLLAAHTRGGSDSPELDGVTTTSPRPPRSPGPDFAAVARPGQLDTEPRRVRPFDQEEERLGYQGLCDVRTPRPSSLRIERAGRPRPPRRSLRARHRARDLRRRGGACSAPREGVAGRPPSPQTACPPEFRQPRPRSAAPRLFSRPRPWIAALDAYRYQARRATRQQRRPRSSASRQSPPWLKLDAGSVSWPRAATRRQFSMSAFEP